MCRKIRNDDVYYNPKTGERILDSDKKIFESNKRPFKGRWAMLGYEYIVDSRGEYIGRIFGNEFTPLGE